MNRSIRFLYPGVGRFGSRRGEELNRGRVSIGRWNRDEAGPPFKVYVMVRIVFSFLCVEGLELRDLLDTSMDFRGSVPSLDPGGIGN